MKVSVIVTTYNRPRALIRVLEGLMAQTRIADQVVVADDGSDRNTARVVERLAAKAPCPILHVWQQDNGFRAARIRNKAIRSSSGSYIVFLDGDCIPNRHFVKDHLELARSGCFFQGKRVLVSQRATASFTCQHANALGVQIKMTAAGDLGNAHHLLRCRWLPALKRPGLSGTRSCNLGVFRCDLEAINGFNEAFVGWGREDSELVARLYRLGRLRRVHPFRAICFHLWHAAHDRSRLLQNDALLQDALASKDPVANRGLNPRSTGLNGRHPGGLGRVDGARRDGTPKKGENP